MPLRFGLASQPSLDLRHIGFCHSPCKASLVPVSNASCGGSESPTSASVGRYTPCFKYHLKQ
ncbi:hypothetical protein EHR06_07910 [Leptospira dzoumogneensis]|uniref:Uncharacterized protein n=1 Tax=Leptospira dzoumogneensis TaxID=2484904 RepID=A0A4Z1AUN6_9LEPT|nr:hypothetical protein EHR06_07910 [Leptospira dzoumogneensis]